MKTVVELLFAWVAIFIVIYAGMYLIASYAEGIWLEFLPQDKSGRITVLLVIFASLFALAPYASYRRLW